MRAAVCTRYGPPEVLQVREVDKPLPRRDEILIKIRATAVTSSDWFVRSAMPFAPLTIRVLIRLLVGMRRPRKPILGLVLAGDVERAGKSVQRFRAGDRVYAFTEFHMGAYAQYTCLRETGIVTSVPSSLTYEEAAAIVYGGLLALHYLRRGDVRSGHHVLIYGASGAVGTSAVQLAKHYGAHVTAVCGPTNVDLVKSLGADAVMDYTKVDTPGADKRYDLVLDAVGKRKTSKLKDACSKALAPGGRYVSVDDGTPRMQATELALLTELVEAGKLKPVIDRHFPLEQIAEAHRYVEQDHKKGNVIVSVSHEGV
jgi:NADPH:quinone reductase-like Zn-dependent oxidoreductase